MRTALGLLDLVIPKDDRVVIFTVPDFDDQGMAMLSAFDASGARVVWLTRSPENCLRRHSGDTRALATVRGVWAYLRASVIVHTHGIYGQPMRSKRKLFVNLWHGMPVKRLRGDEPTAKRQSDFVCVTANVHARTMSECWNMPAESFVTTGLPRNDVMLRSARLHREKARKRVVWLPTYRVSVLGDIRKDGCEGVSPIQFGNVTLEDVDDLAEELAISIVVKPHPMSSWSGVEDRKHVTVIDDAQLARRGTSLYALLGSSDILITDYSSVWIDFLLTQRPVVFAAADMASYRDTRGYLIDPSGPDLPGPVVEDWPKLRRELDLIVSGWDDWKEARRKALITHHQFADASSAQRVLQHIEEECRQSRTTPAR